MTRTEYLVRSAAARFEAADVALRGELRDVRDARMAAGRGAGTWLESRFDGVLSVPTADWSLETIVLRLGRPVLAVVDGAPRLEFADAESRVWRSRLTAIEGPLRLAARAVGRIEVEGHPHFQWVGTGWLVAPDLVVTNRHVAQQFAMGYGSGFTFRRGTAGALGVSIDFLREVESSDRFEARVHEVLAIADEDGPDVAVLRVEPARAASHPSPVDLHPWPVESGRQVAVIGYPARDPRVPDQELVRTIFGDVYDSKRLAPGQITSAEPDLLLHDCSTLGGNSGSVVVDLESGNAVGLHFAGRFLEANYAVPAPIIAEWVHRARRGARATSARRRQAPRAPLPPVNGRRRSDPVAFVEAHAADYVDRRGFDRTFLGVPIELPEPADHADVLTFPWNGRDDEHELTYEHFSVVMSRSRRMCLLSAVNIDGREPRRVRRPAWRLDPRIPRGAQIRDECYGTAPRFSRGHMTRREDPVWGPPVVADRGGDDSMHVTNAVPQMQPFNAGIWLGLEDYALGHARTDRMRISVFTGPFLEEDDPVRFGVRVPREFWKVIAFIHDETGELCATGYTMSQADFLRDDEFVFGQHQTWQTAVADIERRSGVRFGELVRRDPFIVDDESPATPLETFEQIVFHR